MKVDRKVLREKIENVISEGIINAEEVDVTTDKVLKEIELIVRAAESFDGVIIGHTNK